MTRRMNFVWSSYSVYRVTAAVGVELTPSGVFQLSWWWNRQLTQGVAVNTLGVARRSLAGIDRGS